MIPFVLVLFVFVIGIAHARRRLPSKARIENRYDEPPPETPRLVENLPAVLLGSMGEQLSLIYALAWHCTCKTVMTATQEMCLARKIRQYETVVRFFPTVVVDSFPMSVWMEVEWIDFDARWLGITGHIDRVAPNDISGSPFKCCYDTYGRLVLLMRRREDVAVLFQLDDHTMSWILASNSLPPGGCRLRTSMVARMALSLAHEFADRA